MVAQIGHYCDIFVVSEGATKMLTIQEEKGLDKETGELPPVIQVAPPFSKQCKMCFTDASTKWGGKTWTYRAAAFLAGIDEQIITEGEGSAQAGELIAVWSAFQHEAPSRRWSPALKEEKRAMGDLAGGLYCSFPKIKENIMCWLGWT